MVWRPVRWLALAAAFGSAVLASACDDPPAAPPRVAASGTPSARAVIATDAGPPDGAAARNVLSELRRDKLSLAARRVPSQRIAFARDRLARLAGDQLVIVDTRTWKQTSTVAVDEPRRVVGLLDGSLLVLAGKASTWVQARKDEVVTLGRVPVFPETVVLPDRREKRRFWVLHAFDPTLYGYQIDPKGQLETLDFIELPDFDKHAFVSLKDGSYLYTTATGLRRFFPGGKREDYELAGSGEVWRLSTTRRIDRLWLARENGSFELLELGGGKLRKVKQLELGDALDVVSSDAHLAILTMSPAALGKRRFVLRVVDDAGKNVFETDLPVDAPSGSGESWVQEITKNRAVHLAPSAPLVAIGGPDAVSVWNLRTKKSLLDVAR